MPVTITTTKTDDDLRGLLALQQRNQVRNLTPEQQQEQGFVTLVYSFEQMKRMHDAAPTVIAKDGDEVVAYAITTVPSVRADVPELATLFSLFDTLTYEGKLLSEYAYYVVGQVCVDARYRGQGIFDKLYAYHKALYQHQYRLFITDISARNTRSLRAHQRVGFKSIHAFHEPDANETWEVVVWDFTK
ncbi:GNAT family N-acetyltransferase [uncultured Fibrella sp.]|uniref:GNAT family N-acetyltransferase n=1 Tax=uncultured Fibrella sp. TaxID=1284596 RepID=UPI0035C9A2FA